MSTTTARQEIAGNVRAILGKHKSNQTKLAALLGCSQAAVSRRLSGEIAFDTDELLVIAATFDEPLSRIFEGVDRLNDEGIRRIIWITGSLTDGKHEQLSLDYPELRLARAA